MYCSGSTRPDIALAVGLLCRVLAYPDERLYEEALRVLYYLLVRHRDRHADIGLSFQADDARQNTPGFATKTWLDEEQACRSTHGPLDR